MLKFQWGRAKVGSAFSIIGMSCNFRNQRSGMISTPLKMIAPRSPFENRVQDRKSQRMLSKKEGATPNFGWLKRKKQV